MMPDDPKLPVPSWLGKSEDFGHCLLSIGYAPWRPVGSSDLGSCLNILNQKLSGNNLDDTAKKLNAKAH